MNDFQLLLQHLRQPEYVHVLLNPLPVYALAMGVLALVLAMLLRSPQARVAALVLVILGSGSAWPVRLYGHRGYDRVYAMSNAEAQQWLDSHMKRADSLAFSFYATAALALAALIAPRMFAKAAVPLAVATLIAATVAVLLGAWISHAGGQVRHSEFRDGPPPTPVEHHEHHH